MDEKTYYTDNEVSVTSARVIFRGTTYALRNVSSVRMITVAPTRIIEIILIIIGVITFALGFAAKETRLCLGLGFILGARWE